MKKVTSTLILSLMIFVLATGTALASSSTATKAETTVMITYIDNVVGTKYKYGGTSTKTGFDCSGFVNHVFKKMGYELERRSADMATKGTKVAKNDLIPGDLVFFDTNGRNNGGITHVGIYVGDGKFAHASSSKGVRYDSLDSSYYKPRYVTARRVLTEKDYVAFATVTPVEEKTTEVAEVTPAGENTAEVAADTTTSTETAATVTTEVTTTNTLTLSN